MTWSNERTKKERAKAMAAGLCGNCRGRPRAPNPRGGLFSSCIVCRAHDAKSKRKNPERGRCRCGTPLPPLLMTERERFGLRLVVGLIAEWRGQSARAGTEERVRDAVDAADHWISKLAREHDRRARP